MGKLLAADNYDALPGAVTQVLAPYLDDTVNYRNATTIAEREVVRKIHNLEKNEFYTKSNMDKFLVKTLIEAVQEDNCSPLNNPLI